MILLDVLSVVFKVIGSSVDVVVIILNTIFMSVQRVRFASA